MKPRGRHIKPEFFTHELLWQVEHATQLPVRVGYAGIWTWTDRSGFFEWKPRVLQIGIVPYDVDRDGKPIVFEHVMNALANAGFIFKYLGSDGRVYGCVPRWMHHQQINNRESASALPRPSDAAFREHEAIWLRAESRIILSRDALIADPPILGGGRVTLDVPETVISTPDNDLPPRAPRVDDASYQNGTERNGTERKENTPVVSSEPATTPEMPVLESGDHLSIRTVISDGHRGPSSVAIARRHDRGDAPLPAIQGKRTATAIMAKLAVVLEEVHQGTRRAVSAKQLRELQAEFVFTYWANKHDHLTTIMDPKRLKRIVARLEENDGNVGELLYAVDGAKRDKHLMGENDRDRKYDGIQTIFRDREMVERLAELVPKFRKGEPHGMLEKWGQIVASQAGA